MIGDCPFCGRQDHEAEFNLMRELLDQRESQLEEAKAENGKLLKSSAADIQIAYKEGFKQGQYELEYPEADRRTAGQAFAASFAQLRCNALLEGGDEANDR